MMISINILTLTETPQQSQAMTDCLRHDDLSVRAHRITSLEDLQEHLQTDDWHLVIADQSSTQLSLEACLAPLQARSYPTPVILLSDEVDADAKEAMIEQGVTLILHPSETNLLAQTALKLAKPYKDVLQYQQLKVEFSALAARTESLLAETDDRIAYVSDGIIIEANQAFAAALGYADAEALNCLSFIDLIDNQADFKPFLKQFQKDPDNNQGSFTFINEDGTTCPFTIKIKASSFEGEACEQFTLAETSNRPDNSSTATLNNELENLSNHLQQAKSKGSLSLALIHLNDLNALNKRLSLHGMDELQRDLSRLLAEQFQLDSTYRLASGLLAFHANKQPAVLQAEMESFCLSLDDYIFEGKSLSSSYTVTCAVISVKAPFNSLLDEAFSQLINLPLSGENHVKLLESSQKESVKATASAALVNKSLSHESIQLLYQPLMSLQGDPKETYEVTCKAKEGHSLDAFNTDNSFDRWVIIEVTKVLAHHRAKDHDTRLIINLSEHTLADDSFPSWIKVVLKASNLPIETIIFQFNEQHLLQNLSQAASTCKALHSAGFQVAISHFSEQPSSLQLLKHVTPNLIQFSQLLTPVLNEGDKLDQVKALLDKLKELNIASILPNVNSTTEMASLWQLGVTYMAGSGIQDPDVTMAYEFADIH